MQKTIVSLCDYTGTWAAPYAQAGYQVIQVDLKQDKRPKSETRDGVIYIQSDVRWLEYIIDEIYGILCAPPCTDFTTSGAQYWGAKDLNGSTLQSIAIADACLRLVALKYESLGFWALENPIGRLKKWYGDPTFSFNPCDFGGYMAHIPGFDKLAEIRAKAASLTQDQRLTRDEVEIVRASNAYTKKTLIWGRCNKPETRPIKPVVIKDAVRNRSYSPIHWYTGGKSERTKELRSITPEGFAQAFFLANQ